MDLQEYLASIDWGAAILVSVAAVLVGAVLLRFMLATTAEVGSMLPGAGQAAGKAVLDARGELPVDSWVCAACRSVNTPQATRCYRGCGTRDELARALPAAREQIGDTHNGRRNA